MGEEPDRWAPALTVPEWRWCRVLVEGQTESAFTDRTLAPYLRQFGVELTPIQLYTGRRASGEKYRGGVRSWRQIRNHLLELSADSNAYLVTTLLDYYGLPGDVPGMSDRVRGDAYAKVGHVETAMTEALDNSRIRVHLQLHEFEAMLFSDPARCGASLDDTRLTVAMEQALRECGSPELINGSARTAPSKRIFDARPQYRKTLDGPTLVHEIGLPTIRARCPHFNGWVTDLERSH